MSRYITEYKFSPAGGKFTVPTCARFIGVAKVPNSFVLIAEVWGNPELVYEIDIKVFQHGEYVMPESKYIGFCTVGNSLFHFSYTHGEVEDLGSDGGSPDDSENVEEDKPKAKEVLPYIKPAGGMSEC